MTHHRNSAPPPAPSGAMWIAPHATGLLIALCAMMLPDGVNAAMSSTLRSYLMGSFAATPDQITWASILYFAAKLYALLLAARVQERFGQRRALLGASTLLVAVTAASLLVASYGALLVIRVLQGIGGGLVLAVGQGALLTAFGRKRQPLVQAIFALATVMFPATIVPALLGGFAYSSDWRIAYGLVVFVGLAGCLWLFWRNGSLSDRTERSAVPIAQIALMVTALICVVYVLQQGNRHAWLDSPAIVWTMVLAALCLLGLGFCETDGRPTYLRYHCFRYADFTFGASVSLLAGAALFAGSYAIPAFIGGVLAYPAWQSGQAQMTAAGFAAVSILTVGVVLRVTKFPRFLFIPMGVALLATAMWYLGKVPADTGTDGLKLWIMLRGLALGALFLPLTLATLTTVPPTDAVAASGLFNFGRQLGGLIGVAWMQTLETHLVARNQTVFGDALSNFSPTLSRFVEATQQALQGATQASATAKALMLREAFRQFNSVAFNGCFESIAMLFACALPFVILARILATRLLRRAYQVGQPL